MANELRMFPLLGLGGHLETGLGLVGWRPTLLGPIADPEAVGFAAMLIGDKGCVAGGGIGGEAQKPNPWAAEPPTCRDPTRVGTLERWGTAGEPSKRAPAACSRVSTI